MPNNTERHKKCNKLKTIEFKFSKTKFKVEIKKN